MVYNEADDDENEGVGLCSQWIYTLLLVAAWGQKQTNYIYQLVKENKKK